MFSKGLIIIVNKARIIKNTNIVFKSLVIKTSGKILWQMIIPNQSIITSNINFLTIFIIFDHLMYFSRISLKSQNILTSRSISDFFILFKDPVDLNHKIWDTLIS